MKVALLNGLLFCAALLTAHTSADFADTSNSQSQSSSSSQASSAFVEVYGDAVYCVEGPVCSGDAAHDPVGSSCPKKGDKAIDACMRGISSFVAGGGAQGQCIAPADAECRVIPGTRTWGCMWKTEEVSTEAKTPPVIVDSVPASSQSASAIPQSSESVTSEPQATQKPNLRVVNVAAAAVDSESESSGSSTSAIWIGSVAGVCAIAAVVVVVAVVSKRKRKSQKQSEQKQVVITPDNMPAATPKLSKTVFVYTAQI